MPGIFDCHTHTAISSIDPLEVLRTPVTQWVLEAVGNLRRVIEAGVTFVRDPGGADAGIRTAIEHGLVSGPRLQVAVVMLCQTGGHGDGYLSGSGNESSADYLASFPGRPPYLVDGEDEMRKTVRAVLRSGADWIKICTTGGIISPHDDGNMPEFSPEEIAVAVYEAGKRGKGVMAHAFGGEGLTNAVQAGVRSIEHGVFLTEAQAAEMADRGCFLIPTLFVLREVVEWAERGGILPAYADRKALSLKPRLGEAVAVAQESKVKIALGSDFVRRDLHGRNLAEIPLLHQAGISVEETLLAATINGAELLGVADRYGRIASGYVFDAIVVDSDPGDLSVFERQDAVSGVFKAGVPIVRHPRLG